MLATEAFALSASGVLFDIAKPGYEAWEPFDDVTQREGKKRRDDEWVEDAG